MRGGKQYGNSQGGWLELLGWCTECDLECRGESSGHVLDSDILRAGIVEVQPSTGGRVTSVRTNSLHARFSRSMERHSLALMSRVMGSWHRPETAEHVERAD
jgi:hypothetical protein